MRNIVYFALIVSLCILCSCSVDNEYQQSREMMDTVVTITLYAKNSTVAEQAFDKAFSEMQKVEDKFSVYKNSTAYTLNEKGYVNADKEFISVLRKAKKYSELTNGSFDITVKPMLDLYEKSFSQKQRPPTADEINQTLSKVDYKRVKIENNSVRLNSTEITLGGIVKGYAIDQAIGVLKENNIDSALVNAGGDLYGYGKKKNNKPWRIAVKEPDNNNFIINRPLENRAVATSGSYERYFNENKSFHHIVNPLTGYSAKKSISATVLAPNATAADALATAVFIMGHDNGMELIKQTENVEAMIISQNKSIYYSPGFNNN